MLMAPNTGKRWEKGIEGGGGDELEARQHARLIDSPGVGEEHRTDGWHGIPSRNAAQFKPSYVVDNIGWWKSPCPDLVEGLG